MSSSSSSPPRRCEAQTGPAHRHAGSVRATNAGHRDRIAARCRRLVLVAALLLLPSSAHAEDPLILRARADSLYQTGRHHEAALAYEELIRAGAPRAGTHYDAACCWALVGDADAAFRHLDEMAEAGGTNLEWMNQDPDLRTLRNDPRWGPLTTRIQSNIDQIVQELPESHLEKEIVPLPPPRRDGTVSVEKALASRRSVRTFAEKPLDLSEISQLLWAAYGVTLPKAEPAFLRGGFRTAPSAGALYPLEIYVVAGDVRELPDGIYKYDSGRHVLIRIASGDRRKGFRESALGQEMIERAPAVIVYSAVFERTTRKYGPRGRERYVWMDAGHSAQNVYLQAEALGLGCCVSGAFSDLDVRRAIGMTQAEEPIYIVPVGRRP